MYVIQKRSTCDIELIIVVYKLYSFYQSLPRVVGLSQMCNSDSRIGIGIRILRIARVCGIGIEIESNAKLNQACIYSRVKLESELNQGDLVWNRN